MFLNCKCITCIKAERSRRDDADENPAGRYQPSLVSAADIPVVRRPTASSTRRASRRHSATTANTVQCSSGEKHIQLSHHYKSFSDNFPQEFTLLSRRYESASPVGDHPCPRYDDLVPPSIHCRPISSSSGHHHHHNRLPSQPHPTGLRYEESTLDEHYDDDFDYAKKFHHHH